MSGRGRRGKDGSGTSSSRRRATASGAADGIEPGVFPIDSGTAEILPDPWTDGAWLLTVNGAESSQLNPQDPLELGFEYMRWMAAVMMHRWSPEQAPRILHLGGAGCTLARWAAAWYPQARQTAVELDAGLAALARDRFALPRAPQLRIRVEEAGVALARAPQARWDVVIRDVFAGPDRETHRTPAHLMGIAAAQQAARVVGDGIYLVNHGGGPDLTEARREAATLRTAFSTVVAIADPQMLKGRRRGNIVFAATNRHGAGTGTGSGLDALAGTGQDALVRHLLADPLPARLVEPLDRFAAGAAPFEELLPAPMLEEPPAVDPSQAPSVPAQTDSGGELD